MKQSVTLWFLLLFFVPLASESSQISSFEHLNWEVIFVELDQGLWLFKHCP